MKEILLILMKIIILVFIFYIVNIFLKKNNEYFCYGNDFCNGNKDSALCINQSCKPCGLQASCNKDSDCGPNNCINGCCDQM
jgi:hypothetical protein